MKWKITIRFILAMLVVSVVSSLINVLFSLYFSYEDYSADQLFNKFFSIDTGIDGFYSIAIDDFVSLDNSMITIKRKEDEIGKDAETNDETLKFAMYKNDTGDPYIVIETLMDSLSKDNGWIQVIDSTGKEIQSINKPEEIKTSYTLKELDKAVNGNIKVNEYLVKGVFEKLADSDKQFTFMIGIPKPGFELKTMIKYYLDYFRYMDTQKIVSIIVTLAVALFLGYLLAIRLNRPVARITDRITALAGGDYNADFPEDSFFKDVFKSLDNMANTLKGAEIEREKIKKIREEWITNISHDLKTPLSTIKGYSELLHESGSNLSKDELKNYIGVILEKTVYMDALINDLKLSQNLKNDAFPLNKQKGNLVELLRDTVIGILNDTRFENRHIHFNSESDNVWVEFDSHLLKRAFTNLLMNALVHNGEETEIWARIYRIDTIIVEICDNGKGISPDEQEKLFKRYYRGTSTNDFYDGSGLGLAISQEIIKAHGGSISLKSSIGKGTVVRISL